MCLWSLSKGALRVLIPTFLYQHSFGRETGGLSLATTEKVTDPFAEAFDFVQTQMDHRFILSVFSFHLGRLLAMRPKMTAARKTLDNYVYDLIDGRSNVGISTEKPVDLLGLFMSFSDEKGMPLTRDELKDSAMNLIIAGR